VNRNILLLLLLFLISMSRLGGDLSLCVKPLWSESPDCSAAPAPLYKCKVHSLFKNSPIVAAAYMFKDPVCNMMVDEKKAKFVSESNGRKVYLCSAACKSQFDANPSKYGY
jgi:YHS domain-containing protein